MRRRLLLALAIALLALPAYAAPPKLIVWVIADDLGPFAVSAYGSNLLTSTATTPTIDALASAGYRATAVTQYALCSPSRAMALAGVHMQATGVTQLSGITPMRSTQTTIMDLLNAEGYDVACFGKWHLGGTPDQYGCDEYAVFPAANPQGDYETPTYTETGGGDVVHTGGTCVSGGSPCHADDETAKLASDWIAARNPATDPPAFVLVGFKGPHAPWVQPARNEALYSATTFAQPSTFNDRFASRAPPIREYIGGRLRPELLDLWTTPPYSTTYRKTALPGGLTVPEQEDWIYQQLIHDYARALKTVDEGVDTILDTIAAEGIANETLVMLFGDNGFFLGDQFLFNKSALHGKAMQIPLILRYPDKIGSGLVETRFVTVLDLLPTTMELAEETVPTWAQGRSLVPLIQGSPPADWPTSIYYEFPGPYAGGLIPHFGARTATHMCIHWWSDEGTASPTWELIDLVADPNETTDVAGVGANASILQNCKGEVQRLRGQYGYGTRIQGGGAQTGVHIR